MKAKNQEKEMFKMDKERKRQIEQQRSQERERK